MQEHEGFHSWLICSQLWKMLLNQYMKQSHDLIIIFYCFRPITVEKMLSGALTWWCMMVDNLCVTVSSRNRFWRPEGFHGHVLTLRFFFISLGLELNIVLSLVWPLKLWFSPQEISNWIRNASSTTFPAAPKTIIRAVLSSEFGFSLKSAVLHHRSLPAPSRPVPVRPRRRGLRSWGGQCFLRQRPSEASNSSGLGAGRSVTPPTVSTDPPVQKMLEAEKILEKQEAKIHISKWRTRKHGDNCKSFQCFKF